MPPIAQHGDCSPNPRFVASDQTRRNRKPRNRNSKRRPIELFPVSLKSVISSADRTMTTGARDMRKRTRIPGVRDRSVGPEAIGKWSSVSEGNRDGILVHLWRLCLQVVVRAPLKFVPRGELPCGVITYRLGIGESIAASRRRRRRRLRVFGLLGVGGYNHEAHGVACQALWNNIFTFWLPTHENHVGTRDTTA